MSSRGLAWTSTGVNSGMRYLPIGGKEYRWVWNKMLHCARLAGYIKR
jgi:hypothetical protein